MLGAALWVTWWWLVRKEKIEAAAARQPRRGADVACKDATLALVLPVIVVVGLKFGVFTPTEAAVVAAVYALFVSTVIYRELKLSQLYGLFVAGRQDHRGDHVPGRRRHGVGLDDHGGQPARRSGRRCCSRCWTTRRCC